MCGIAGMYGHADETLLKQMLDKMTHRGPDNRGLHVDSNLAIGQTRLSIIDVAGGKQPIYNEEGNKLVVCNGEIYNHSAIRSQLKGHLFRTRSDTEAILHLFEEETTCCASKLHGMFAFAVAGDSSLYLARDPLGIKPLYYGWREGVFYFASEMKALLGVVDRINEFPPGTFYTPDGGFHSYYHVPDRIPSLCDEELVKQRLQSLLGEAVEERLMSDVPVGVFLSGGIDSSIVALLAAERLEELNTFSVGVGGSEDLEKASLVADTLGTVHHEHIYDGEEMLELLRKVIYHLESFDFALVRSAIPNFFVSRLAKEKKTKVIMTGEGSDELLAGYQYLKSFSDEDLYGELWRITTALHNSNLQRTDRMTMANSVEGRVPFLDVDFVQFAASIPMQFKIDRTQGTEKWVLRKCFENRLPSEVIWRRKQKFSEGAGSSDYIHKIAEYEISDAEFRRERRLRPDLELRNKEELYYYRIFKEFYDEPSVLDCISFTQYA